MRQTYLYLLLFSFFSFSQERINDTPENEQLVKEFGLALSKSYTQNNAQFFLDHISFENLYPAVILTDTENKALTKFNKKFKPVLKDKLASFPKEMIKNLKDGNFYNFNSYFYDDIDKTYHILFRSYQHQTGINYHDYKLLKKDGEIVINDVYIYTTNQLLSEILKLYYLGSVPKNNLNSLTAKNDYKYILMLKNFTDAANKNEVKKAYQHISILNKALKGKDRFVASLKLDTARALTEEAYFESMEDILANFYHDPSINLMAINYHHLNKDYDEIDICLNKLYNHTNDNFLDFEKGNASYAKRDYESAASYYQSMIENYPQFITPYFSLLMTYEKNQQATEAIVLLDQIISLKGYNKKDLTNKARKQLPFISTSKVFKKWCKK